MCLCGDRFVKIKENLQHKAFSQINIITFDNQNPLHNDRPCNYIAYHHDKRDSIKKLSPFKGHRFFQHPMKILRKSFSCINTLLKIVYFSSHHSFSFRTCSSSAGVKSFLMLKVFLISSGDFPLIMLATVLQVTSSKPLMSK